MLIWNVRVYTLQHRNYILLFILYRGDKFREAYNDLGQLISFFKCPFVLLTATMTDELLDRVTNIVHLDRDAIEQITVIGDRYATSL